MSLKRDLRTTFLLISVLVTALSGAPESVSAHPMGNFSINHFSALAVHPPFILITYVIDMAEIPTFQEIQDYDLTPQPDHPSVTAYRDRKVQDLRRGLWLQVGSQTVPLSLRSSTVTFPPGAGGLPTLRISAVYEAPLAGETGQFVYEDRNYLQRVGWKEIIATASNGVRLTASSVPADSRSKRLTSYTADLLQAPPQDLRASVSFTVSATAQDRQPVSRATPITLTPEAAQTPHSTLTELMTARQLSLGLVVFSLLVAAGLGAFHALEPGHGKTLVAAYLVGSRGTAWHALLLGLTVTASHTVGVYALGGVALFASRYVLPERLYPWLGFVSGVLIMVTGVVLLRQARQRCFGRHRRDHGHGHPHEHAHSHDRGPNRLLHSHLHPHLPQDEPQGTSAVSYGALLTLGITGGMIPCPAALVVLLSAVALQRIAFGLLLIVAFSIGLAAVLVGTGLLLVSARGMMQRWTGEGPWLTYLPFFSPLVITPLGLVIALRSLIGGGLVPGLSF